MTVDLNCDLGELNAQEFPEIFQILDYVSSCNISCGVHAGDLLTIQKTITLAYEKGVKVGIHPSFPDRPGFGRKAIQLNADQFKGMLSYQLGAMKAMLEELQVPVHHAKAHGALYHFLHENEVYCKIYLDLIRTFFGSISIYGIENSILHQLTERQGQPFFREVFADRRYASSNRLISRREMGAVLSDRNSIRVQLEDILLHQRVQIIDGSYVAIAADTICLHGDNPGAQDLSVFIYHYLKDLGYEVA